MTVLITSDTKIPETFGAGHLLASQLRIIPTPKRTALVLEPSHLMGTFRMVKLVDTPEGIVYHVGGIVDRYTLFASSADLWIPFTSVVQESALLGDTAVGQYVTVKQSHITDSTMAGREQNPTYVESSVMSQATVDRSRLIGVRLDWGAKLVETKIEGVDLGRHVNLLRGSGPFGY